METILKSLSENVFDIGNTPNFSLKNTLVDISHTMGIITNSENDLKLIKATIKGTESINQKLSDTVISKMRTEFIPFKVLKRINQLLKNAEYLFITIENGKTTIAVYGYMFDNEFIENHFITYMTTAEDIKEPIRIALTVNLFKDLLKVFLSEQKDVKMMYSGEICYPILFPILEDSYIIFATANVEMISEDRKQILEVIRR